MSGMAVDLAVQGQAQEWASVLSVNEERVPSMRFFEVDLYVEMGAEDGADLGTLSPGQRFRLRIRIKRPSNPVTEGWKRWSGVGDSLLLSLHDDADLLQFDETDYDGTQKANPYVPIRVKIQDLAELDGDQCLPLFFNVTVPPACLGFARVGIELKIQEAIPGGFVKSFPQPPIRLLSLATGPHPLLPSERRAIPADLRHEPVPGAAWLRVRRTDADHLAIRCSNAREDLRLPSIPTPDIDLAQIIQDKGAPKEIFGRLRDYSRNELSPVGAWLKRILSHRQDGAHELCLMVEDLTDAEIPWEMIETEPNRFFGAQAVIARWFEMSTYGGQGLSLAQGEVVVEGDTVHFVDKAATACSAVHTALRACRGNRIDSLDVLFRSSLAGDLSRIALVYVASHGVFHDATRPRDRRLSLWAETRQGAVHDIDLAMLPPMMQDDHRFSLPLLFMNACHSGRMTWHEDQMAGHGMPEQFLSRVARAYVGTLGDISADEAERIGARLIDAARDAPGGLAIAELLMRIRRDAADGFDGLDADDAAWRHLLNSFMYVYYGDPRIRLRLRSQ